MDLEMACTSIEVLESPAETSGWDTFKHPRASLQTPSDVDMPQPGSNDIDDAADAREVCFYWFSDKGPTEVRLKVIRGDGSIVTRQMSLIGKTCWRVKCSISSSCVSYAIEVKSTSYKVWSHTGNFGPWDLNAGYVQFDLSRDSSSVVHDLYHHVSPGGRIAALLKAGRSHLYLGYRAGSRMKDFCKKELKSIQRADDLVFLLLLAGYLYSELLNAELIRDFKQTLWTLQSKASSITDATSLEQVLLKALNELFFRARNHKIDILAEILVWSGLLKEQMLELAGHINRGYVPQISEGQFGIVRQSVSNAMQEHDLVLRGHQLIILLIKASPNFNRLIELWDLINCCDKGNDENSEVRRIFSQTAVEHTKRMQVDDLLHFYETLPVDLRKSLESVLVISFLAVRPADINPDDSFIKFACQLERDNQRMISRSLLSKMSGLKRWPSLIKSLILPHHQPHEVAFLSGKWFEESVSTNRSLITTINSASELLHQLQDQPESCQIILQKTRNALSSLTHEELLKGHKKVHESCDLLHQIYLDVVEAVIRDRCVSLTSILGLLGLINMTTAPTATIYITNPIMEKMMTTILEHLPQYLAPLAIRPILQYHQIWRQFLGMAGCAAAIKAHRHITGLMSILVKYANYFDSETVTQRKLNKIKPENDQILVGLIAMVNTDKPLAEKRVHYFRQSLQTFFDKLEWLRRFLSYAEQEQASDYSLYIKQYDSISAAAPGYTIAYIEAGSFWGVFKESTLRAAALLKQWNNSTTFHNIRHVTTVSLPITVDEIANRVFPAIEDRHKKACNKLTEPLHQIPVAEMTILWANIDDTKLPSELALIEKQLGIIAPPITKRALEILATFPQSGSRAAQVLDLWRLLAPGVTDNLAEVLEEAQKMDLKSADLTLNSLNQVATKLEPLLSLIQCDKHWSVIEELASSKELFKFIEPRLHEDFRTLIDAVEEHSDQFIRVQTVSDLIAVRQFLEPILGIKPAGSIKDLLNALSALLKKIPQLEAITLKLKNCNNHVHGLSRLFTSVANRSELTKQTIEDILNWKKIRFLIESRKLSCEMEVAIKERNYHTDELIELRSRALLLVNSDRGMPQHHPDMPEDLTEEDLVQQSLNGVEMREMLNSFIWLIDTSRDIVEVASQLCFQGHFRYASMDITVATTREALLQMKEKLEKELFDWKNLLEETRKWCYYLNYFHSNQLQLLDECFSAMNPPYSKRKAFFRLLNFIDPSMHCTKDLCCGRYAPCESAEERVKKLAEELNMLFSDKTPQAKTLLAENLADPLSSIPDQPLVVFTTSKARILHTVAGLYHSTSTYPRPSHLLFCTPNTQWEELNLILRRCFYASSSKFGAGLYCIANIEALEYALQSQLVKAIHDFTSKHDSPSSQLRLALICCPEGKRHHIIEEFANCVHTTNGFKDEELKVILVKNCPAVQTITSDLPGAGKTETARRIAFSKKLGLRSLAVTGSVTRSQLISQLQSMQLRDYEALHIDITNGVDGEMMNTFLFELLLTGMITAGTALYQLRVRLVLIEVANSMNNELMDSLPICFKFPHLHLKSTVDRIIVSREVTSPIQVVCNYLLLLSSKTIDQMDLYFEGTQTNVKALPDQKCQELLQQYFFSRKKDLSFSIMNVFLNILSLQYRMLSRSYYFTVKNLKLMVGNNDIRTLTATSLLEGCLEFATRSVATCRDEQLKSVLNGASSAIADRMKGMIRWQDSNHLVVLFNQQNSHTISVLYRDESLLPKDVGRLLKSQASDATQSLDKEELLVKLQRIVSRKSGSTTYPHYALTPDNLLKMILIYQRIQGRIPVIIMGETGCGKTSLVKFLALAVEATFQTININAGTTIEEIKKALEEAEKAAQTKDAQVWLFFDEINTSEHIGFLGQIVCHRMCEGRRIHPRVHMIAACNPYRLRSKISNTAGLVGKISHDECSKLVYRVHPLPEIMMDYVWDYGSLDPRDEGFYISAMVKKLMGLPKMQHDILVALLSTSQQFIRSEESDWSVSLRDVRRCITLMKWFKSNRARDDYYIPSSIPEYLQYFILGLAHCYHCRLPDNQKRKAYREAISAELSTKGFSISQDDFRKVLYAEQRAYLQMMERPPGIALNGALLENVFVVLVCILNRIPIFLVGKPGCSKSLSLQLINANLRGPDSKAKYFQKQPSVYMVSYQGSESSTSAGIKAIFDKAQKYYEHNKLNNVIPVVLLDEVGLAEASKYNPLKVLHSLLEPGYPKEGPDVAVVGISNWALDAAKMNRAIHLSRPEPDVDDLIETGKSIQSAASSCLLWDASNLRALAEAYYKYYHSQSRPNFHGLRDYYSLVKSLARNSRSLDIPNLIDALARNFGGMETHRIEKIFIKAARASHYQSTIKKPSVIDRILANLVDTEARHMLLITEGDSAINILDSILEKHNPIIIHGSRFVNDQTEHYSYRILSIIILCMETGKKLILCDLDHIYGSLYDMLNQNYTVVGNKRNCRIALGAFSNPMCHVHPNFRCIVIVDNAKLDQADPPFLNRFEKQLLTYEATMEPRHIELLNQLKAWTSEFCTILRTNGEIIKFAESECFIGSREGTLASLILLHSRDEDLPPEDVLSRCKADLLNICPIDAILRSKLSALNRSLPQDIEMIHEIYFNKQEHRDLAHYFDHVLNAEVDDMRGVKTIISTFSNIHVELGLALNDFVLHKVGTFSAERDLTQCIQDFWSLNCEKSLLILQFDLEQDYDHLLLTKFAVDRQESEYLQLKPERRKHAIILIHCDRAATLDIPFNFLSKWRLVTIDLIERKPIPLDFFLERSIEQILKDQDVTARYSFKRIFNE